MKKHFVPVVAALMLAACSALPAHHHTGKSHAMHPHQATLNSIYNFNDTVSKIRQAVESKGMTVFAVIDHQAAAQKAGLTMQPATVLVFGNPKAGTPLMVKDPAFALQLPLKVLITETDGKVQVSYVPAQHLILGSKIAPADVENTLAKAEGLIRATVSAPQ
ncbi:MAG: DUF302 domain-containing protein [Conchiformibius sp.]|nr:DUF302 domain-containing protein [Conchiformibius sp.]